MNDYRITQKWNHQTYWNTNIYILLDIYITYITFWDKITILIGAKPFSVQINMSEENLLVIPQSYTHTRDYLLVVHIDILSCNSLCR